MDYLPERYCFRHIDSGLSNRQACEGVCRRSASEGDFRHTSAFGDWGRCSGKLIRMKIDRSVSW